MKKLFHSDPNDLKVTNNCRKNIFFDQEDIFPLLIQILYIYKSTSSPADKKYGSTLPTN